MDDELPPDIAALRVPATVKVRFEFSRPPFRAYYSWNGTMRSVARWGPFRARTRAYELFGDIPSRAIDRWFEDQRAARRERRRARQIEELLAEVAEEPADG